MSAIALGRGTHLVSYIDYLADLGAPVERGLERCGLPPGLAAHARAYVPILAQGRFLAEMGRREGVDHLGWRGVGDPLDRLGSELASVLGQMPTLERALHALAELASLESSRLAIWVVETDDAVFLCHRGSAEPGVPGIDDLTEMRTRILLSAIRCFAGESWVPTACALAVDRPIGEVVREGLGGRPVMRTRDTSWIELPRRILPMSHREVAVRAACRGMSVGRATGPHDFASSLACVLEPFVETGVPRLQQVARALSMSPRTLQRRLTTEGTSYQRVVDRVRFEAALAHLDAPDAKLVDVANALGFRDQAHFSHFFTRMCGQSPRAYRRTRCAQ